MLKWSLNIHYIIWLIIACLIFGGGEYFSKKFALAPSFKIALLAVSIYLMGMPMWLFALYQRNQLSIVGAIWSVISCIVTVLIGVLFFSEQLDMLHKTGIILALISIFILSV